VAADSDKQLSGEIKGTRPCSNGGSQADRRRLLIAKALLRYHESWCEICDR